MSSSLTKNKWFIKILLIYLVLLNYTENILHIYNSIITLMITYWIKLIGRIIIFITLNQICKLVCLKKTKKVKFFINIKYYITYYFVNNQTSIKILKLFIETSQ